MTKREFAKWAQTRTREVAKSGRYGCTVAKNGTTVCVDTSTGKVGIARLHPDDDYVFETGVAIAYARCKGIEVPKINVYKKLSEMKNGERFVSMIGDIYKYIARDNDSFVVWNEKCKIYVAMPFDFYYEMVD
jgi:hypothetical protein